MSNSPNFGQQPEKSRDDYIREWDRLNKELSALKLTEKAARDAAVSAVFQDSFDPGTNTRDLGNGFKFKCQYATTYKFVIPESFTPHPDRKPDVVDAVNELLGKLRRHGNEAAFIADRLVKWKPELVTSEYKELPDHIRKIVDEYIETDNKINTVQLVVPATAKV